MVSTNSRLSGFFYQKTSDCNPIISSAEIVTICSWHLQVEQETAHEIPADSRSTPKVENYTSYYILETRMCTVDQCVSVSLKRRLPWDAENTLWTQKEYNNQILGAGRILQKRVVDFLLCHKVSQMLRNSSNSSRRKTRTSGLLT